MNRLLLYIVVLVLTASCADPLGIEDNVKKTWYDDTFLPLALGNQWEYMVTDFDSSGKVTSQVVRIIKITKDTIISGTKWYFLDDIRDGNGRNLLYVDNEGLWQTKDSSSYRIFNFSGRLGDSISLRFYDSAMNDTLTLVRKIMALNEELKTAAGSFKCCKFWEKICSGDSRSIYDPNAVHYYSRGVGLIKQISYRITRLGEIYSYKVVELISYKIIY